MISIFLCEFFQGLGRSEWEEQVPRDSVSSSGGGNPLSSGPHLLLLSSRGGTGARGEADQTSLPPQPAEPLPRGGDSRLSAKPRTPKFDMSLIFYHNLHREAIF